MRAPVNFMWRKWIRWKWIAPRHVQRALLVTVSLKCPQFETDALFASYLATRTLMYVRFVCSLFEFYFLLLLFTATKPSLCLIVLYSEHSVVFFFIFVSVHQAISSWRQPPGLLCNGLKGIRSCRRIFDINCWTRPFSPSFIPLAQSHLLFFLLLFHQKNK